jgi:hypothetical protein
MTTAYNLSPKHMTLAAEHTRRPNMSQQLHLQQSSTTKYQQKLDCRLPR